MVASSINHPVKGKNLRKNLGNPAARIVVTLVIALLAFTPVLIVNAINPQTIYKSWWNPYSHLCEYDGELDVEPTPEEVIGWIADDYPYDPCEVHHELWSWNGSSYDCYPPSCESEFWNNLGHNVFHDDYEVSQAYGYWQQRESPYAQGTEERFASE